jgi:Fic family protein
VTDGQRHTVSSQREVTSDPDELAKLEAENGLKQAALAFDIIRNFVKDPERPFKLRNNMLLQLHAVAMEGVHPLAGTFRNAPVKIGGSDHEPPHHLMVADEVSDLCSYVNENWQSKTPIHLCAYTLWKLNWIHPFADGNGRTARAVAYVVLSVKLDSLLPGTNTIPDQIAADKRPYYSALEKADHALKATGKIDVSALEEMLSGMFAKQLLEAVNQAEGASSS